MGRVYNFSAGPACLPEPVLKLAGKEMIDWHGIGYSVMEMSHREKSFSSIYEEAHNDLRELMDIPDSYEVLFLGGSASIQFSAIPLNFASEEQPIDYIVTGDWSKKAFEEGARLGKANIVASTEKDDFNTVPAPNSWTLTQNGAYLHYCPNETIRGNQFPYIPETDGRPLIADMSSVILSQPIDVAKFGVIYAGAQKNIGPAGLAVVIIRKDLLKEARQYTPKLLNYSLLVAHNGLYNTPPTYSIYIAGLVFKWLKSLGGVKAIEKINESKARKLYSVIDNSKLFYNKIDPLARSQMNVTFFMRRPELQDAFLKGANENGLVQLRGHRTVGGLRASLYNALPEEAVDALIKYMHTFEAAHTL